MSIKYIGTPDPAHVECVTEAVNRINNKKPYYGIFFEMGVGKTYTMIHILRCIFAACGDEKKVKRTLIMAPKGALHNWKAEILKWSHIKEKDIVVIDGNTAAQRVKQLATKLYYSKGYSKNVICLINYEALRAPLIFEGLLNWGNEVFVGDESHNFKNHKSGTFKHIKALTNKTDYRYILTGTPLTKGREDIWSQFYILDRGETFGDNFFAFKKKYFTDRNAHIRYRVNYPDWVIKESMKEEFKRRVNENSMRAKTEGLPPLVNVNHMVPLGVEQGKFYNKIKKNLFLQLEDRFITSIQTVATVAKLRQIVAGFVYDDSGETLNFFNIPKERACRDLIKELSPNHKIIVWAVFKPNYKVLREMCQKMRIKCVEYHGDVSTVGREEVLESFRNDEEVRVLIAHPYSCGSAVNLIESDVSIYYSKDANLVAYLQSSKRNHRKGSERHKKITHYHLTTEGTVEEDINQLLVEKKEISNDILIDYIKKREGK